VFAGGLKNGIEHLPNLLGSAFPSDFLNLRFGRMFRRAFDWERATAWRADYPPPTYVAIHTVEPARMN
jgi:hypothetical protein